MKARHVTLIILLIIFADQALKLYVKTHMALGDSVHIFGEKFQLYYVENPGMAYGWKFGGTSGKMALTLFRLLAVIFGTWYLGRLIAQKYSRGFLICASLIYAGALGNLIDSAVYGMIFDKGMLFNAATGEYDSYEGISKFASHGYASLLHGNVVDMLYFPVLRGTFPSWFPVWGGKPFEFFRPIFNIADASISIGVISILLFQKRIFRQHKPEENHPTVETHALVNDESQVS